MTLAGLLNTFRVINTSTIVLSMYPENATLVTGNAWFNQSFD